MKKGARKLIVSLLKENCEVTSKIVQGLIFVLRTQKRSPDQYKATSYFYFLYLFNTSSSHNESQHFEIPFR